MTLIPTHGLRWNNGVLEQRYIDTGGRNEIWRPVPSVQENAAPRSGKEPVDVREFVKTLS
jgi:hypothetical protein